MAVDRTTNGDEMALAAKSAGLRYMDSGVPGIIRSKRRGRFAYTGADGKPISDVRVLSRIASLVIPPAWTDVWICPFPNGHLQAIGRDARGRRQYRYHPLWTAVRDATKYDRTIEFARALPRLRRRVGRDLGQRGLSRQKVVAAGVRLLDTGLIRIGNDEYARENRSFGLTTLRGRHAQVRGESLKFSFRGKSGKQHDIGFRDKRLARVVRACQELPGQRLFQYLDVDGNPQHIDSDDINNYLRDAMGDEFSAKDFRTWAGTVAAVRELSERAHAPNSTAAIAEAVKEVAHELGNTAAVCRKCYIHPAVIDAYEDGSLDKAARRQITSIRGLRADEALALALLKTRAPSSRRKPRPTLPPI